jgi:hypothetical protein
MEARLDRPSDVPHRTSIAIHGRDVPELRRSVRLPKGFGTERAVVQLLVSYGVYWLLLRPVPLRMVDRKVSRAKGHGYQHLPLGADGGHNDPVPRLLKCL